MNEMSHASFAAAAAISPEFWYSTSFSGTCSLTAAALASSTVTPRAAPDAGSRVAQNVEAAGPTAIATRSEPVGAMLALEISSAATASTPVSRAMPATTFVSDDFVSEYTGLSSEIRRLGFGKWKQVLVEVVAVVLGAYRFQQLVLHLAPALDHVKRLVERVGILDDHVGLERIAVRGQLEPLDHMFFLRVRRLQIIDVAVLGGQPDSVHDKLAILVSPDRLSEP